MNITWSLLLFLLFYTTAFSQVNWEDVSDADAPAAIKMLLDSAWDNRSNNPNKSIEFSGKAEKLAVRIDDKVSVARSLSYRAVAYNNLGAYQSALKTISLGLVVAKETHDSIQIGYGYNTLGDIYIGLGNFTEAALNIQKSARIFKALNHQRGIAYTEIMFGRLNARQRNYDICFDYFNRALNRVNALRDTSLYARILLDIAKVHLQSGDFNNALKTYQKLEFVYAKGGHPKSQADTWTGIATIYLNSNDYKEAEKHLQRALYLHRSIPNIEGEIKSLNLLTKLYLSWNKKDLSERYLDTSLTKAAQFGDKSLLVEIYDSRVKLAKAKGNNTLMLKHLTEYEALRDSITALNIQSKFIDLDNLLAIERAEHEMRLLEKQLGEQAAQRNFYILLTILLLLVAVASIYAYSEKKRQSAELAKMNEFKDRFFSILAHDLKSPFNNVLGALDILQNAYDEYDEKDRKMFISIVASSTNTIYALLDNLLSWSRSQQGYIKFNPQETNLKKLITDTLPILEHAVKDKNITLNINIAPEANIFADTNMLQTVVRNLASNSVKFLEPGGVVKINHEREAGSDIITVEDNGPGIKKSDLPNLFSAKKKMVTADQSGRKSTGLGLIICNDFVKIHGGSLEIESEEGKYTRAIIKLPVKRMP